jgi:4-amino-4-deoxy-L-arabinose transferase-like glycosyltransferase
MMVVQAADQPILNRIRSISRYPKFYLILILLVYCVLLIPTVGRHGISWDEQTDIEIARGYISRPGGWFTGSNSDPSQARLPMYAVAMIYKLTGTDDLLTARFISVFVGALTILGVYIYCKQEIDSKRGILAAGILATSPFFLSFARIAFTETDIYVACAFIWFLVSISDLKHKRTLKSAVIAAVLLGLAISTKFTAIFMVPAILIHVITWSRQDSEQPHLHPRDFVGIGGFVVILFSMAWYGWNNVGFTIGAENDSVVAVMYYLLTGIWWVAILIWIMRRSDNTTSPLILGILVLVLAISTFIMFPPVHLTNPDIIQSLFNRFDSEMGLDLGFMVEAIGLHIGSVIFKSSPLVGFGLAAGVVGALFQWKRRKQVRFPLLVVLFYCLGLVSLPIAQTFYMMPLLPILAILGADQWFRLLSNSKILAILIGGTAALVLFVDLARCYPDYNLNGYQWLGPSYFISRPSIGYRSIVQTTSDGVQQTIQWVCEHARSNDWVAVYAYPWHIVKASCPDPPFRISRGKWESVLTRPDYVIVHINHRIWAKWSAWFSGMENNPPADSVFWEPYDVERLHTSYTKVYSVPRAFGLEMASVWQRNDQIDNE